MTEKAQAPQPGRFIVLEGIDGSGTTTQVALLVDRLRQRGLSARGTREPSDGPIGTMLRQALTGRLGVPGGGAPGWATMALLFAADRVDHVEADIAPFVRAGGVIVSDRYDASSVAYQSVASRTGRAGGSAAEAAETVAWIRALNQRARRPDLTIVLSVPPELAATRRETRGDAAQLYEKEEMQRALAAFYADLERHMPGDRIAMIDGTGAVDAVHARVAEAAFAVLDPR